jgi:hypothetical protein
MRRQFLTVEMTLILVLTDDSPSNVIRKKILLGL